MKVSINFLNESTSSSFDPADLDAVLDLQKAGINKLASALRKDGIQASFVDGDNNFSGLQVSKVGSASVNLLVSCEPGGLFVDFNQGDDAVVAQLMGSILANGKALGYAKDQLKVSTKVRKLYALLDSKADRNAQNMAKLGRSFDLEDAEDFDNNEAKAISHYAKTLKKSK